MPSTPTPRLRVMQQARGENLNAWGDPNLNNALARLEEGQAKVLTLVITGDYTLTVQNYLEDEARSAALVLTGSPSAAFKITIPAAEKPYIVINTTGQIATVGTAGGVGAQVRAGLMNTVVCNGTDTRIVDPTLDQVRKATATVDFNGQKLINAGSATADTDVPTFGQIKSSVQTAVSAAGTATTAKDTAITAKNDAVTAKDAAVAAQQAAETVYDNFDDRYLGAKSADPIKDNDGATLLIGALYFNTTTNLMRVYTGSVWQNLALNASDYLLKSGGTMSGLISFFADQYATQAEAQAGTNTAKLMTPRRVADAIASLTPAPSAPGLVFISSQAITSPVASVSFTGLNGDYDRYLVCFETIIPSTNSSLYLRSSSNNGATFDANIGDYFYYGAISTPQGASYQSETTSYINITSTNTTVRSEPFLGGVDGLINIIKPSSNSEYTRFNFETSFAGSNGNLAGYRGTGQRSVQSSVNAVTIFATNGNIASGYLKLYGYRKV